MIIVSKAKGSVKKCKKAKKKLGSSENLLDIHEAIRGRKKDEQKN